MKPREAYNTLYEQLSKAGVEDAGFEADVLIKQVCGRHRLELEAVAEAQWARLAELGAKRAARQPLQYLLGSWPFLGLELQLGPGVLCPRPETEDLCLRAAEGFPQNAAPAVLDLCAGSGAIALGLQSLLPGAVVTAVELDPAAFGWLEKNTAAYKAAHPGANCPRALLADALDHHRQLADGSLDLLCSNPPYVTEAEYQKLEPEVLAEPKQALVPKGGEADGLLFYRRIANDYRPKLRPGGRLLFEIGAAQGPAVGEILRATGYGGVDILPDRYGRPRIALAAGR